GLEVTIVGAVAARMTEPGSGINLTSADIGTAAAIYVAGACVGALLFGRLTDRYGRKKLFMLTLGIYILATVATAFAHDAWFLYLRSEEHTSELQSRENLVCRRLLEKKKQ